MRKTKSKDMEIRAKTVALHDPNSNCKSYLQLRNRRLQKPPQSRRRQGHSSHPHFRILDTDRESTPCDLIRDPDIITTPGYTTSLTSPNGRVHNSTRIDIPLANELDEFFTSAEKELQKSFIDKYNFDPVTDKPLPGRFEWEKVHL